MRAIPILITLLLSTALAGRGAAQEAVILAERLEPGHVPKVDVGVTLSGKLAVPTEKGKPPQLVPLTGNSRITYDERVLSPDEAGMLKTVRIYREADFVRVVGGATQDAGIRPSVRRMVIIKTDGRRAPFSPDG